MPAPPTGRPAARSAAPSTGRSSPAGRRPCRRPCRGAGATGLTGRCRPVRRSVEAEAGGLLVLADGLPETARHPDGFLVRIVDRGERASTVERSNIRHQSSVFLIPVRLAHRALVSKQRQTAPARVTGCAERRRLVAAFAAGGPDACLVGRFAEPVGLLEGGGFDRDRDGAVAEVARTHRSCFGGRISIASAG